MKRAIQKTDSERRISRHDDFVLEAAGRDDEQHGAEEE
jgi:hypothetical protein